MGRMKSIFRLNVALWAVIVLLPGCMRDGTQVASGENDPVEIATRAAIGSTIDGLTVGSVRIIAIDDTGRVVFNEYRDADSEGLDFEERNLGDILGNFIVTVMPATYDFYAVVNETAAMNTMLDGVTGLPDMKEIKLPAADLTAEGSMICVGSVTGVRVLSAVDNETHGKVSIAGATAVDKLNIPVVRASAKLTIKVRKQTADPLDRLSITDVSLSNVPQYCYMMPETEYDGTLRNDVDIFPGTAVAIDANSTEYTEVVTGYIMPEYLMADPDDETKATRLKITADYITTGNVTYDDVEYALTPLSGVDASGEPFPDFDMARGTNYVVNVTIDKLGGFDYYITYEVDKWTPITDDPTQVTIGDGQYTITGNGWTGVEQGNIQDGGNTIRVNINGSVAFEFTLERPLSGRWTAQLSNPTDFYFDEVAGVRQGVAGLTPNLIVIRPYGVNESDVSTEFYINIDNGTKEIEWNLNNDGGVGSGNRYVIKQIPR